MQFTQTQRTLAIRAMGEAEQHTAQYYCIPPYRWERLNFDLLTRQDHEWEPLPEAALARIRRLIRPASQKLPSYDFLVIQERNWKYRSPDHPVEQWKVTFT